MQKRYTYEVTAEATFKDSFDWQTQADEWWLGDVEVMQEALVLFMITTDSSADRWEGAQIPEDAVSLSGPDWSHESTEDVPADD